MKKLPTHHQIVIYQTNSGKVELRGDFEHENIWATQAKIAQAFGVDTRTINEHIKNIYRAGELEEKATIRKFRTVQKERPLISIRCYINSICQSTPIV